jgi:hypothetical protein
MQIYDDSLRESRRHAVVGNRLALYASTPPRLNFLHQLTSNRLLTPD